MNTVLFQQWIWQIAQSSTLAFWLGFHAQLFGNSHKISSIDAIFPLFLFSKKPLLETVLFLSSYPNGMVISVYAYQASRNSSSDTDHFAVPALKTRTTLCRKMGVTTRSGKSTSCIPLRRRGRAPAKSFDRFGKLPKEIRGKVSLPPQTHPCNDFSYLYSMSCLFLLGQNVVWKILASLYYRSY